MSDYAKLLLEIIDYAREKDTISYYDIEAYAYREKPEWIPVFKNRKTRRMLSEYLKGIKRRENRKYDTTLYDALMSNLDAKIEYYEQHDEEYAKSLDTMFEEIEKQHEATVNTLGGDNR